MCEDGHLCACLCAKVLCISKQGFCISRGIKSAWKIIKLNFLIPYGSRSGCNLKYVSSVSCVKMREKTSRE